VRLKLFGFAGVRMLRYNTTTIYGADSLLGLADSLLETMLFRVANREKGSPRLFIFQSNYGAIVF